MPTKKIFYFHVKLLIYFSICSAIHFYLSLLELLKIRSFWLHDSSCELTKIYIAAWTQRKLILKISTHGSWLLTTKTKYQPRANVEHPEIVGTTEIFQIGGSFGSFSDPVVQTIQNSEKEYCFATALFCCCNALTLPKFWHVFETTQNQIYFAQTPLVYKKNCWSESWNFCIPLNSCFEPQNALLNVIKICRQSCRLLIIIKMNTNLSL